ncbi:hypothetical protein VTI28DRAFT_923 [Corynascus sepedonium]
MTDGRGGLASSDQRWTLGRGPSLAQQPQAAGQTHTQFVTTTRGRALIIQQILAGCSSGDLIVHNAPVLPPPPSSRESPSFFSHTAQYLIQPNTNLAPAIARFTNLGLQENIPH